MDLDCCFPTVLENNCIKKTKDQQINTEDVSDARQKLLHAGLNILPDESIYGNH